MTGNSHKGIPAIPGSRKLVGTDEKNKLAALLQLQERPLDEIAEATGHKTRGGASKAAQRYYADNPVPGIDELRAAEILRLSIIEKELWESAHAINYVVAANGTLVRGPDGQPLIDREPNDRARAMLLKVSERRCRLMGMDAAKLSRLTIESVDEEIRRLETEVTFCVQNAVPAVTPPSSPPAISPPVVAAEPEPGQPQLRRRPERGRLVPGDGARPELDGSRRQPQDGQAETQDYAAAYQPVQQVTEPERGWTRHERRTSWD